MKSPRNYRILILAQFLQGIVFYAPVATLYRQAYGLDLQGLFLIESISWILTLAFEAPWGRVADRIGYKKTLLLGNILFFSSKIVFATASGFWAFLAERCVLALAISALSGCSDALLYRSVGPDASPKAFGRLQAAGVVGLLLSSATSPLIYSISLRAAAWATAIPYAIATLLTFCLVDLGEEGHGDAARGPRGLKEALKSLWADKGLLAFVAIGALVQEASHAATVFLAPLQLARSGLAQASFGPLFAIVQAAALAAAASGRISAAFGRARTLRILVVAECLALAALALSSDATISVAALVVAQAAAALFMPLSCAIQNDRVRGSERATALSVNAMVAELVGAAVNVGVGQAAGLSLPICFGSLGMLLGMALAGASISRSSILALEPRPPKTDSL
jgi:predicted MFS family arabinose efflux permease